jgi:hypothetical protein
LFFSLLIFYLLAQFSFNSLSLLLFLFSSPPLLFGQFASVSGELFLNSVAELATVALFQTTGDGEREQTAC